MAAPKPKRKRLGWNEISEAALLDLWPERVMELRTLRKNGQVYAEMADDLSKLGYIYTPRDVQVKLQNFKARYKKENEAMSAPGGKPSAWLHYARVHQIIGGFKDNFSNDLKLENTNDRSIPSPPNKLLSAPSSPSSPQPPDIPSSASSPAASALEHLNKVRESHFQATVLHKFENMSSYIAEYLKKNEENEKEAIEIERKKADSLAKIANDCEELKNALISFLNKR